MSPDKIPLKVDSVRNDHGGGILSHPIRFALPYYRSGYGTYIHRVRSGSTHRPRNGKDKNRILHLSFHFWCGNIGCINLTGYGRKKNGQLFATVPEGGVVCATCEGRAIGAGMDGARTINGIPVIYSPRK